MKTTTILGFLLGSLWCVAMGRLLTGLHFTSSPSCHDQAWEVARICAANSGCNDFYTVEALLDHCHDDDDEEEDPIDPPNGDTDGDTDGDADTDGLCYSAEGIYHCEDLDPPLI